jgi:hypothetical protein
LVTARGFYTDSALRAALAALALSFSVACGYVGSSVSLVYPDPMPLLAGEIHVSSPIASQFPGYRAMPPMPNFVSLANPRKLGLVDGATGGSFLNPVSLQVFETENQAAAALELICRNAARLAGESHVKRISGARGGAACAPPFWRRRGGVSEAFLWGDWETELAVQRGRLVVSIRGQADEQTPQQAAERVSAIARELADKLALTH